jgi:Glyoxalase-like domain
MLLGVDHFVIAVGDLAAAMRDYAALGFSVVPGGRHTAGTHNALIAFADGVRFAIGPPGAALDPRLTHGAPRSFG